ncbi:protein UBASH3A homolog [Aplysia californica]|uniref:Protein UBASH3A homolog n=1 Tax=Aplysia californica TaxID=6500 RepID=A0ABM0JRA6_APLCA|nr:protein UBASH3A homolog [Aplysia californica]
MAGVPPRSRLRSSNSSSSFKDRSPLETLQRMGFPKARAEKAIAATGNKGVQRASEWLLAHVNDPALDSCDAREYILYLCPVKALREALRRFWETTLQVCGWNSAHLYQPHITFSSFFKMPDSLVNVLDDVMATAADELQKWPMKGPLGLELITKSKNFIGYFVTASHHQFLEQLMIILQQAFHRAGVEMKPQMKQLHMTLAFQYEEAHHDLLMKLAQEVNAKSEALWELRMYSREATTKNVEVRRVIKDYSPLQADELLLKEEDFVYMEPEEHERSPDGWFKGTSWTTGTSGFFPGNFTTKCSQMEIWTLHRKLTLPFHSTPLASANGGGPEKEMEHSGQEDYDNLWLSGRKEDLYAKVNKSKTVVTPRKLFVIRHAERCDFAFFRKWFEKSFDATGKYCRFNINCPRKMVPRASFKDFNKDCPLTEIGKAQARITGEAIRDSGETVSFVYCSPALRCVETATEILKGLGSSCKINIEPTLFEWLGWYKPNAPIFISPQELSLFGYPVDPEYSPHQRFANIKVYESTEDYYMRSHSFAQYILRKLKPDGGNVLFVGHSGTPDACTRQLRGKPIRNHDEFRNIVRGCPYCFVGAVQEDVDQRKWNLCEPPVLPLTHLPNKEYDWRSLLE